MSELVDHGAAILAWLASTDRYLILEGDSAKVAPSIPDASIDAIVADPPAGIAFMGKAWDDDKGGEAEWIAWLAGIMAEGYRVLKPGGHCLLWALPRTSDWTMQALRRAGFEVRDVVTHLFGSGFPKSLDVSKAIDAAAGAEREVVGMRKARLLAGHIDTGAPTIPTTIPTTPEARKWSGFGTALKPAAEFWILARKPLDGTVAASVVQHGTGALNIDAARVASAEPIPTFTASHSDRFIDREDGVKIARTGETRNNGRFPANLVLSHTAWEETHCRPCGAVLSFVARFCPECGSGAVEHRRAGCCAVGERRVKGFAGCNRGDVEQYGNDFHPRKAGERIDGHADPDGLETVTAWECLATCACGLSTLAPSGGAPPRCRCGRAMAWACPVARLDEQSGGAGMHSAGGARGNVETKSVPGYSGGFGNVGAFRVGDTDQGAMASRFFNTFAPPDDVEPFFYPCTDAKPCSTETGAQCPTSYSESPVSSADPTSSQRRDGNGSAMVSAPPSGQCASADKRNPSRLRAKSAKLSRSDTGATDLFGSAPSNAPTKPSDESAPGARCAASPSAKCETSSALRSAVTDLGRCPGLPHGMASTTEHRPRTLSPNHVSDAAPPESTGTTTTIQSPSRSNGSAFFVIDESTISESRAGLGHVEPFLYSPKPSAAEAEAGCEALPLKSAAEVTDREEGSAGSKHARAGATHGGRRNHHPTRKSIALMRHFCRLVCPPGGVVLDMFAGSGTTIGAWGLEGGRAIGIEMDPEFVAIARARAAFWGRLAGTRAATVAKPRPVREKADTGQGMLF